MEGTRGGKHFLIQALRAIKVSSVRFGKKTGSNFKTYKNKEITPNEEQRNVIRNDDCGSNFNNGASFCFICGFI